MFRNIMSGVCCAIWMTFGMDGSLAMHNNVLEKCELEPEVSRIASSVPFYEGELDPEKFITDQSVRAKMRQYIVQMFVIRGDNFNSAYAISKLLFLSYSVGHEKHLFAVSQDEELSLIDDCVSRMMKETELPRRAPCLYLAYTYSNRKATQMFCDRMVQFENTKVLAELLRSCLM